MNREIFRGRHYRAVHSQVSNDPLVVVNFEFWWPTPSLEDPPTATEFFTARGINFVGVRGARNDWFQDDEILDVIGAVRATTEGCRRVGYGGSMGGFAIVNFAHDLALDSLVAVSPQFSIDRAKAPFETRWAEDGASIEFRHDRIDRIAPIQRGHLIYDPDTVDADHARLILRRHPIAPVQLRFAGHDPLRMLNQAGVAAELLIGLVTDRLDRSAFVRHLRAGRTDSGVAWLGAAETLSRRGDARAALRAILRAKSLPLPDRRRADLAHAMILRQHGRTSEALALLAAYPEATLSEEVRVWQTDQLHARVAALESELAAMRASSSWRLTAPLRALNRLRPRR